MPAFQPRQQPVFHPGGYSGQYRRQQHERLITQKANVGLIGFEFQILMSLSHC